MKTRMSVSACATSTTKAIGIIRFDSNNAQLLDQYVKANYTKLAALNGLGTLNVASLPTKWLFVPTRKSVCGDGSGTVAKFYMRIFRKRGSIVSYKHFMLLSQNLEPVPGIDVAIELF